MTDTDRINAALRQVPTWPLYLLSVGPVVWLFYAGLTGGLGVDPTKAIEHQMGLWALWLLIASLAISPLARFANLKLIKFRRAIGLIGFAYVLVHLLIWLLLDVQIMANVWKDILKRPYITIGMLAFVLLVPLAATSNNWSIRKMGPAAWQRLHKLAYLAVLLGGVHYVMLVRGWQVTPLLYLAAIVVLLALRMLPTRRRPAMRASVAR